MKNFKNNSALKFLRFVVLFGFLASCETDLDKDILPEELEEIDDSVFETTDWTTETHSKDAEPNFTEVFEDNSIKRLDIVITASRWKTMLENMTSLYGAFGTRSNASFSDENPIMVPAEVFYKGKEWYRVGVRFKGNSSLQRTWENGNLKLSFKLDFDEFEDTYPEIDNQRFYGFKKLSLKNNFDDKSMLREKIATDLFRNAGLASSHASFFTVYVDHGEGPVYFGVYTLVEEVDDTVIKTQFASKEGNLYKPDGNGASFELGSFTEATFVKETNEDDADWTDINTLFSKLHEANRITDPAAWRTNLETILDTEVFLKYLAVNTVIQNWDTYGRMTHNYFLYANPENKLLTWIPWDNNEALQTGKMQGSLPLDFSNLNQSQWPLIGFLYADEVYRAKYDAYVEEVSNSVFNPSKMQELYTAYGALIAPFATTEIAGHTFLSNSSDFQTAINQLKTHASERNAAVVSYLKR